MIARQRLAVAAAVVLALGAGAATAQDDAVTLRFSHFTPPMHPLHTEGLVPWADSINEASGGSITIEVFPAQQLGRLPDHYDMARDGIADFAVVNAGVQPGRFPIIATGEQPFLVANARGGSEALDAWYRAYAEEEMSDVKFCLAHHHPPGTIHATTPVRVPADLQGMRVRPANATMAAFLSELGAQAVQVSAPESRDALERGIADAITFPWDSILTFRMADTVPYHLDLEIYATTFVWVMNRASYERLSDAQKAVIDDHCANDWVGRVIEGWNVAEDESRGSIAAMEGHEVITPTAEEVALWREAAEAVEARWADGVRAAGHDPETVRAALISELEARDSRY
jgi:TRAP-type C4-dicarboxylate transport system substrate-binding protein